MADLASQAAALRGLHRVGEPLLLANVWDVASAKMVEEVGFSAVATSSSAVAHAFGELDTDGMPLEVAFGAVERVAKAVSLPVTADLEAGYQLPADELVRRVLAAGAVGLNLEDSDHHGSGVLVDLETQTERIAAVRRAARKAGVDVVINARVDVYVRRVGDAGQQLKEGVRRGRAYLAAGADCVYPITISDEHAIGAFVDGVGGAVNVNMRAGTPPLDVLRRLNVARVSLGGGLFRIAITAAKQAAEALRAGTLFA
ncbi:MAG TPA: isocitrate lyase/phosphoenolpyruvate mutase family protein [Chloroflexota bacterium]|nr:isocitrate lyase/phosphoenolpyruvate mutase family protein [Chloroflexota bacterium]